jgi:RNA polymerase sigma-70 factor (ECF subfamily)
VNNQTYLILLPPNLLHGCIKKDRKSQKELYMHYYGHALRICSRYTKNKDDAVEVVNDGFMKVFTNISQYDTSLSFLSWLNTIMINTSIDHYRKRSRQIEMTDLDGVQEPGNPEIILSNLNYRELIGLIQKLPHSYRAVFNLFAIDGYKHEEISEMLQISVGASKSNLFKARGHLKKMIVEINRKDDVNTITSAIHKI